VDADAQLIWENLFEIDIASDNGYSSKLIGLAIMKSDKVRKSRAQINLLHRDTFIAGRLICE
jgi:hypothetical protein